MKFTVQPWSPEYGSPAGKEELEAPEADVDIEVDASKWAPIVVNATPADEVLFVDGVRRIDANLWIEEEDGTPMLALAASYGAGAVLCNHSARIVAHEIRRGIFTAAAAASPIVTRHADYDVHPTRGIVAEDLWLGLQQRMGELEGMIVASHTGGATHRRRRPAVASPPCARRGRIHQDPARPVSPPEPSSDSRAAPGRRPDSALSHHDELESLLVVSQAPVEGCRADGRHRSGRSQRRSGSLVSARRIADLTAATMCRYASAAHKDPRAPQNLYPVGQLERKLHHLLGDRELLYRSLRVAAA